MMFIRRHNRQISFEKIISDRNPRSSFSIAAQSVRWSVGPTPGLLLDRAVRRPSVRPFVGPSVHLLVTNQCIFTKIIV